MLSTVLQQNVKVQDLFNIDHSCETRKFFLNEMLKFDVEKHEVNVKLAKVMNIISKEFDKKYDRYLYDAEVDPKDDNSIF